MLILQCDLAVDFIESHRSEEAILRSSAASVMSVRAVSVTAGNSNSLVVWFLVAPFGC
jgi:hypothetical protein